MHCIENACCDRCQKIINKFETAIAKDTYPVMRALYNFQTRSKEYPDTVEINHKLNAYITKTVKVPIEKAPITITVPKYPLPFFISYPQDWPTATTLQAVHLPSDKDFDEAWKNFFRKYGGISANISSGGIIINDFSRLIYKIAIGFMWISLPDIAQKSVIKEMVIDPKFPDFPKIPYLYSAPVTSKSSKKYKIRIFTIKDGERKHLFVGIRLMASTFFPEYFCDFGDIDTDIDRVFEF